MPFKYSEHTRRFITHLVLKKGRSIKDVVHFSGVSRTSLWRWLNSGIKDKPICRIMPKQSQAEKLIGAILNAKPHCTLSMMRRELELQEVSVCTRTVHRMLQRGRYSRKRAKRTRVSHNCTPASKAQFRNSFLSAVEDGQDLLFMDECHFSNNVLPLFGYSKVREPCVITQEWQYRTAHSLIMAVSVSGQYFYRVYEGSVNKARMQVFFDHLPSTRIVLDNLQLHKSVVYPGAKIFTPVAQPYANPIEILFSKLKDSFRYINATYPTHLVSDKIEEAIECLTDTDVAGAVRHVQEFVTRAYPSTA